MNNNQKQLVKALVTRGVVKNKEVERAMEAVDRGFYSPKNPYEDKPQSVGYGTTITAPHMHAYALEYLYPKLITAKYALDVGSGLGYLTAAMALLIPAQSKVYGIDHVQALVTKSINNITQSNPEILSKIVIQRGDGRLGWGKGDIKFDVIHVGAAAEKIPEALLHQLAEGGKMIIPVGPEQETQQFLEIDKINGKIVARNVCNVRYVPLTDLERQIS